MRSSDLSSSLSQGSHSKRFDLLLFMLFILTVVACGTSDAIYVEIIIGDLKLNSYFTH